MKDYTKTVNVSTDENGDVVIRLDNESYTVLSIAVHDAAKWTNYRGWRENTEDYMNLWRALDIEEDQ